MEDATLLDVLSGTLYSSASEAEKHRRRTDFFYSHERHSFMAIIWNMLYLKGFQICVVFEASSRDKWVSSADIDFESALMFIFHDSTKEWDFCIVGNLPNSDDMYLEWRSTDINNYLTFPVRILETNDKSSIRIEGKLPYLDSKTATFDKRSRRRDLKKGRPFEFGMPEVGNYSAREAALALQFGAASSVRDREYVIHNTNVDMFLVAPMQTGAMSEIGVLADVDGSLRPLDYDWVERNRQAKRERVPSNDADEEEQGFTPQSAFWKFDNDDIDKILRLFPSKVKRRNPEWAQVELLTQALFGRWELSVLYLFADPDLDDPDEEDEASASEYHNRLMFELRFGLIPPSLVDQDNRYKSDHWLHDFSSPLHALFKREAEFIATELHPTLANKNRAVWIASTSVSPWMDVYWNRNPNDDRLIDNGDEVALLEPYPEDFGSDSDVDSDFDENFVWNPNFHYDAGSNLRNVARRSGTRPIKVFALVVETPGPLLFDIVSTVTRAFAAHSTHRDTAIAKAAWFDICVPRLMRHLAACFQAATAHGWHFLNIIPAEFSQQPDGVLKIWNFADTVVYDSLDDMLLVGNRYAEAHRASEYCSPTALFYCGDHLEGAPERDDPDYAARWRAAYNMPHNQDKAELAAKESMWTLGRLFEFVLNGKIRASENMGPETFRRSVHVDASADEFGKKTNVQTLLSLMLDPDHARRPTAAQLEQYLTDLESDRTAALPPRFIETLVKDRRVIGADIRVIERLASLGSSDPGSVEEGGGDDDDENKVDDLADLERPKKRRAALYGKRSLAHSHLKKTALELDTVVDARTGKVYASLELFPDAAETAAGAWLIDHDHGISSKVDVFFFGIHTGGDNASDNLDYAQLLERHLQRRRAVWALLAEDGISGPVKELIRENLFADFSLSKTEPRQTFDAWTRAFDHVLPRVLAEMSSTRVQALRALV